jgi:hypothetical protein
MVLGRINGFTGEFLNVLFWAPAGDEAVFVASNTLVAMSMKTSKQRFFHGHSARITACSVSSVYYLCLQCISSVCLFSP